MTRRNLGEGIAAAAAGLSLSRLFGQSAEAQAGKTFPVSHSEEEWRSLLTPEQYRVLRQHGTERAGTSPLDHEKRKGTFVCAGCGEPLFTSERKFNSGTGWPSFYQPIEGAVETSVDNTLFMARTEAHCARCGGHLGHLFDDGPPDAGGMRFCVNSCALDLDSRS